VILLHIVGRTYDLLLFVLEKKCGTAPLPTALPSAQPCRVPFGRGCADGNAIGTGAVPDFLREKFQKLLRGKHLKKAMPMTMPSAQLAGHFLKVS
jgi:hypothetical protein